MGIDVTKLTDLDIRKFKREIQGYEKTKKLFLILGFIFLGVCLLSLVLFIVFLILGIIEARNQGIDNIFELEYVGLYFSLAGASLSDVGIFLVAMLVMFVLRGVLFTKKTENRLAAIEEYEIYKKQPHEEEKLAEVEVAEDIAESDILPPLKEVGASCSMTLMSQA